MEIHYQTPCPALRGYVRTYYYFATDRPAVQPLCAELGNIRILLAGGGRVRLAGEGPVSLPAAALLGPTTGAYVVEAEPGTRVFGVGILPRGWGAFLGVSAEEVADSITDLTALMGPDSRRAMEAIVNASSLAEMAAHTDRLLLGVLERRRTSGGAYPTALEKWLSNSANLGLADLLDMMDVSHRQTDRLAKRYFGASPKLLQRKYRALRAADHIGAGGSWLGAAGDSFYDQSHFIKEFKTFIGVTPAEYAAQATLIHAYRAKRRALAGGPLGNL